MAMVLPYGQVAVLGGPAAAFAPTDLANLVLWLKADDGPDDPVDDQPVATWSDKSGNGRDATQGTAAQQPTYKTDIQNGKPAVQFDGVDDDLATTNFTITQPYTIFVVDRNLTPGGAPKVHISNKAANNNGIHDAAGHGGTYLYSGSIVGISATPQNFHIYQVAWNGAATDYAIDGGSLVEGINPGAAANPDGLVLGSLGATNHANIQICEVIVYDPAIADADRISVRDYLNDKYAIY